MSEALSHITVLLDEAVCALSVHPAGRYVDGTFGRGGHSRLILQQLDSDGHLLGFDKDPLAIATGLELQEQDARFSIVQRSFAEMDAELQQRQLFTEVDGVLLDLGVSSPQLDDAQRALGSHGGVVLSVVSRAG